MPPNPKPSPPPYLQDHDRAYIRVTFNLGSTFDPFMKSPSSVFLKELSFRSVDLRHANKTVQDIKMLRSSVQQRDKERLERATLVAQERLISGEERAETVLGKGGGGVLRGRRGDGPLSPPLMQARKCSSCRIYGSAPPSAARGASCPALWRPTPTDSGERRRGPCVRRGGPCPPPQVRLRGWLAGSMLCESASSSRLLPSPSAVCLLLALPLKPWSPPLNPAPHPPPGTPTPRTRW